MVTVFGQLRWSAILLATVAYYVLGAIWFTPVFGRFYDKALGFERAKGHKWPPIYYIGPFISSLFVTVAISVLIYALDVDALSDVVLLGLIVGVGCAASISFNNAINPKTPIPLLYGAVTGGYHVIGILVVAAVIFALK